MNVWPGAPYPLGATWDGSGVNFALFSENATGIELCLFDGPDGNDEVARIPVTEQDDLVWHSYLPEVRPGQRYGYRVHGPYDPENGHRFNPSKLLLDPYAKAIDRTIRWSDALFGYEVGHPEQDLQPDSRDSATWIPKSVVIDPAFTWGDDRPIRTPWSETIIYEVHVKGFTARHPDVRKELRGTYAGLSCPPAHRRTPMRCARCRQFRTGWRRRAARPRSSPQTNPAPTPKARRNEPRHTHVSVHPGAAVVAGHRSPVTGHGCLDARAEGGELQHPQGLLRHTVLQPAAHDTRAARSAAHARRRHRVPAGSARQPRAPRETLRELAGRAPV